MNELKARLHEGPEAIGKWRPPWWSRAAAAIVVAVGFVLPFFFSQASGFLNATIIALAYVVMALGLNVVVGFAGLLDLGYVAFYALGAYSVGWFGSSFFFNSHIHVLVSGIAAKNAGIHLNFILILVAATVITA